MTTFAERAGDLVPVFPNYALDTLDPKGWVRAFCAC